MVLVPLGALGTGVAFASTSSPAVSSTAPPVVGAPTTAQATQPTSVTPQAVDRPDTADQPDATKVSAANVETPEPITPEVDGPGGHQDAPGANVDHQFEGSE